MIGPVKKRQKSWRMFAAEYNMAKEERKGTEQFSPTFILTPLGALVNRLYFVGVLTEKENRGTEEEPLWNARVNDQTGNFYISAGNYQQAAADALALIEPPAMVSVVGKVRSFVNQEGSFFVSVRPDSVRVVGPEQRQHWLYTAARDLHYRILEMQKVRDMDDITPESLRGAGIDEELIEGLIGSHEAYGFVDTSLYRTVALDSLKFVLSDLKGEVGQNISFDTDEGHDSDGGDPRGMKVESVNAAPDEAPGMKVESVDAAPDDTPGMKVESVDAAPDDTPVVRDEGVADVGWDGPTASGSTRETAGDGVALPEESGTEPATGSDLLVSAQKATGEPPSGNVELSGEQVLDVIKALLPEDGRGAILHDVVSRLLDMGVDMERLDDIFEELLENGSIYKPSENMVNII